MPTTIQNPQLMSSSFGSADSVVANNDGTSELVVPALLALVEGDPKESQACRNERNEVSEEAPRQLPGGGLSEVARLDDLCLGQHFSRRCAAEAPEQDRRDNQSNLHPDVEQGGNRGVGTAEDLQYSRQVCDRISRRGRQGGEFGAEPPEIASPVERNHQRKQHDNEDQHVDEESKQPRPETHVSRLARHHGFSHGHPLWHGSPTFVTEATALYDGPAIRKGRA